MPIEFGKTNMTETALVRVLAKEYAATAVKLEAKGIRGELICTAMAYYLMETLMNSGYTKEESVVYFTNVYDELKKIEGEEIN